MNASSTSVAHSPAPTVVPTVAPAPDGWRLLAGTLIAGMLLVSIAGALWVVVPPLAAPLLAWSALALLWPGLRSV